MEHFAKNRVQWGLYARPKVAKESPVKRGGNLCTVEGQAQKRGINATEYWKTVTGRNSREKSGAGRSSEAFAPAGHGCIFYLCRPMAEGSPVILVLGPKVAGHCFVPGGRILDSQPQLVCPITQNTSRLF